MTTYATTELGHHWLQLYLVSCVIIQQDGGKYYMYSGTRATQNDEHAYTKTWVL